jgi:hypothetical protein
MRQLPGELEPDYTEREGGTDDLSISLAQPERDLQNNWIYTFTHSR